MSKVNLAQVKASLENALRLIDEEIDAPKPDKGSDWRDARMPEDWGKPCRVRDGNEPWTESRLWGCDCSVKGHQWVADDMVFWDECQVRITDQDQNVGTSEQTPSKCTERDFPTESRQDCRDCLTKEQLAEFLCSDEFLTKLANRVLAVPISVEIPITRPETAE
jgi:hypothetical protein